VAREEPTGTLNSAAVRGSRLPAAILSCHNPKQ